MSAAARQENCEFPLNCILLSLVLIDPVKFKEMFTAVVQYCRCVGLLRGWDMSHLIAARQARRTVSWAVLSVTAIGAAGCSPDTARFDNPFGSPYASQPSGTQMSAAPVRQPAVAGVERQALPPAPQYTQSQYAEPQYAQPQYAPPPPPAYQQPQPASPQYAIPPAQVAPVAPLAHT